MEEKYVAFFDSGVGGLTLLSAFCRAYPGCPTLYFGDNANAPYGDRPAADIRRLGFDAESRAMADTYLDKAERCLDGLPQRFEQKLFREALEFVRNRKS